MIEYSIINELAKEALTNNTEVDNTRFTHAFVNKEVIQVLYAIRACMYQSTANKPRIYCNNTTLTNLSVYVQQLDDGTILWFPQSALSILPVLSRELDCIVNWISVYEEYTCRAFIQYYKGKCICEKVDPEYYWINNILYGEDLAGQGQRGFNSLKQFLESISTYYAPKDTAYDYENITQYINNDTIDLSGIRPFIKVVYGVENVIVDYFVEWPSDKRKIIEEKLINLK